MKPTHTFTAFVLLLCAVFFAPLPAEASSKLCSNSAITAFINRVARKADVRPPYVLQRRDISRPQYRVVENTVETPRCATLNELHHEFGHHVLAMAANGDPAKFYEFSGQFRQYRVWLKTSQDPEGFERAAHCVGFQLGGRGAYTRCPFKNARQLASWMISTARYFAPYVS